MKKLKLLLLALMATCGLSLNAANKVVGDRFTSLENLAGKLFAVVNEDDQTAMGIGVSGHGSGWDMYFGTYNEAYASNACYYKLETAQGEGVDGYYYIRTYNSDGTMYYAWGDSNNGYLNSQPANGTVCFSINITGMTNGTDIVNGGVWAITESEGKFAIKNIGTGKYLKDSAPAKYDDPFYFTFCTLIDDPLPAAQEKYTSLKDKYLAFNANLDVTEVEALYNSATTVAGVQTAIDALISTFGSSLANETSLTALISNPSFESGFTGWTNNGMATQKNNSFVGKEGTNYCEAWQPNGTKGVSQTLTLPQGAYSMSANSLARGVTSAKLYAGSKEKAITIADAANPYNLDFYVSKDGDVTIGFEGVGTGAGTSWICVDNFQLTYIQNMTAEEFAAYEAHKEALEAYNNALAAAQAVGAIPSTASTNLQNAISDNTLADGSTTEQYNTAATALNAAATAAQSLVTPYAVYLDTKSAVVTMKDADTYSGADAKSTLEGVITTTSSNVEEATDASTITAQTDDLVEAAKDFVKSVTIKADQCLDLTCLIKNPHFKYGEGGSGKVAADWTLESGWVTEHRLQTHNFEAWHAHFNLNQTITDLPKGTYKVTLQGFARHDNASVTDKTSLYCGPVSQIIKDIKSENSTTSFYSNAQPAMGDGNRDSQATEGGQTVYRPNGMTGAYYWFREINPATQQPFYTSEVQTLIEKDGDLKIGFKCEADEDWVIWDNFHLYYYGSAIAVTIDENDVSSVYEKNIENANITLKRTFSAGKWNTIALPFDLTDAETKAAFGDDVVVATYSETYTDDGLNDSKVTFDKADDASITANTPVLLKTSTDKTTFTFNGKTIMAGEAKVEGGANFDFVGTYAASTTIAKGDYFISNDHLWQSKGETTIKGTRAYFKAKTEGAQARIADLRIGESETTGIVSVDNGVKTIENATFDLQGRKVANVKKGLYIKNFKKVLVR